MGSFWMALGLRLGQGLELHIELGAGEKVPAPSFCIGKSTCPMKPKV